MADFNLSDFLDPVDSDDQPPEIHERELELTEVPTGYDASRSDLMLDYVTARNVNYSMIRKVGGALETAVQVAFVEQSPRAFDAVNSLSNTLRQISKDLLTSQKTFMELMEKEGKDVDLKLVGTEKVFRGTTTDLAQFVRDSTPTNPTPTATAG